MAGLGGRRRSHNSAGIPTWDD
ncbi:hypothetical protein CCACVL1_01862, partial [Corchorus capsularis]